MVLSFCCLNTRGDKTGGTCRLCNKLKLVTFSTCGKGSGQLSCKTLFCHSFFEIYK
ncbi:hypothetical protein Hanom_Chr12g01111341 [Helianthus anomalus]